MSTAANSNFKQFPDQGAQQSPKPAAKFRRTRNVLGILCWFYAIVTVALWLLLRIAGDQWWLATLLLFGPSWVFAIPLGILVPAAAIFRRRSLGTLLFAAFMIVVPLMDLCIPWRTILPWGGSGPKLRVLTCNVHHARMDTRAMADLLAATNPDIVAMQEYSSAHTASLLGNGQWNSIRDGELFIASRHPLRKVEDIGAPSCPGAAVRYEISTPAGPVQFINLHLAFPHNQFAAALYRSPQAPDMIHENINCRLQQAQDIQRAVQRLSGAVLLAGDFNMPAEGSVYRQTFSSLADAFSKAGFGFGWTYRAKMTRTRIDHVLAGDGWRPRRCWVGPDVGSPHHPVIADLEWTAASR